MKKPNYPSKKFKNDYKFDQMQVMIVVNRFVYVYYKITRCRNANWI